MRKTSYSFILFVVCISVSGCYSQSNINVSETRRLLNSLASDAFMGRNIYTSGSDSAAAFISNEFQEIGLLPFESSTGFEQKFYLKKNKIEKSEIILNGVRHRDFFITGCTEEINWRSDSSKIRAYYLNTKESISKDYASIFEDTRESIVFVSDSLKYWFESVKAQTNQSPIIEGLHTVPKIYVLTTIKEVESYQIFIKSKVTRNELTNIVGVIPGKSKIDEYVIFSAHYDHIGILGAVNGDSIANGADDDASGVTAVISLAKYFKETGKNERTIIFVAFTAEEVGGFGSRYFAQRLAAEKIVAMINIEMVGKVSKFGKDAGFITGFEKTDLGAMLQKNLEGTAFKLFPDPYPEQQLFYRSDNATLAKLGVPAHTISTDQIDNDKYYHTVDDEIETIDFTNLIRIIEAIAMSTEGLVSGVDTPKRLVEATDN